jgi:hypothetical protein
VDLWGRGGISGKKYPWKYGSLEIIIALCKKGKGYGYKAVMPKLAGSRTAAPTLYVSHVTPLHAGANHCLCPCISCKCQIWPQDLKGMSQKALPVTELGSISPVSAHSAVTVGLERTLHHAMEAQESCFCRTKLAVTVS